MDFFTASWWVWQVTSISLFSYALLLILLNCHRSYYGQQVTFDLRQARQAVNHQLAKVFAQPLFSHLNQRLNHTIVIAGVGRLKQTSPTMLLAEVTSRAALWTLAIYTVAAIAGLPSLAMAVVTFVTLMVLPVTTFLDLGIKHTRACARQLADVIDALALNMGAGLELNQALAAVCDRSQHLNIGQELRLVLQHLHLGQSRENALLSLQQRIVHPTTETFCQTIIQSLKVGSDLVTTLYNLADSQRQSRFSQAEEMAGKISVRMMLPMMLFVLPATCIVLLGPSVLQWVNI